MFHRIELAETSSGLTFDVDLEPGKRAYVFIGENGVGKTALLEELTRCLLYSHPMWRSGAAPQGGPSERRGRPTPEGDLHRRLGIRDALDGISVTVPQATLDGRRLLEPGASSFEFNREHLPFRSEVSTGWRPLVFVGAGVRSSIVGIGPEALKLVGGMYDELGREIRGTIGQLDREPADTAAVSQWLAARMLVNPDFLVGLRSGADDVRLLCELLRQFDPVGFEGVIEDGRVNITYDGGRLFLRDTPIDRLASGYTALVVVLQRIVASVAAWENLRGGDLRATDAIILVDEADAHLHPRWQDRLVPFLKESFPNATFVLATHSPLMVRDTEPGEAYELQRVGAHVTSRRLGSPSAWFLGDLFATAFGVRVPSPAADREVGEEVAAFVALVQQVRSGGAPDLREQARRAHAELVQKLPATDPRRATLDRLVGLVG
ncbi:MAG: ATP-binding protein [Alphaproteobacteria bacterium]|nr:ATP-binding protein [Alphaproteobacteria bacterium]